MSEANIFLDTTQCGLFITHPCESVSEICLIIFSFLKAVYNGQTFLSFVSEVVQLMEYVGNRTGISFIVGNLLCRTASSVQHH